MTRLFLSEKKSLYQGHAANCAACAKVDIARPATLSNCCLTGARMLKDFLGAQEKKTHQDFLREA